MASPRCNRVPVITRSSSSGGRRWRTGAQETKEQYSLDTLEESLTSDLLDSLSLTGELQMLEEQEWLGEEQEFHQLSTLELRQLVEEGRLVKEMRVVEEVRAVEEVGIAEEVKVVEEAWMVELEEQVGFCLFRFQAHRGAR